jgi:hypothetical protein
MVTRPQIHLLSEKDFEKLTAVCAVDGPVAIQVYGNTYRCRVAFLQNKKQMALQRRVSPNGSWRAQKGDHCEACGLVALDPCQLDQDHWNGDRTDHRPENGLTLCASCHRLKSHRPEIFYEVYPDLVPPSNVDAGDELPRGNHVGAA